MGVSLLLAAGLWLLPTAAGANGPPDRGDGASRITSGDNASEYWDLLARFDSGHFVFGRFMITNEGPGEASAAAFGYVLFPDGRSARFDNAQRSGGWQLSADGRYIEISSSILDQRQPRRKFEYDSNKRGVKIHLWFQTDGALPHPEDARIPGYEIDLLDTAAPVEGTLWVKGMAKPIEVKGTLAATHTWMERSESEITARRIEFFSLGAEETSLYLSDLTTPDGAHVRWLVARRGPEVVYAGNDFSLEIEPPAARSDYPLPRGLRLRGPELEGTVGMGPVLVQDAPFEALPQPFRFLLSLKARPRRLWAESRFDLKVGSQRLSGSGVTSVTYTNPLPPELSGVSGPARQRLQDSRV
jgi:hypothetical protein